MELIDIIQSALNLERWYATASSSFTFKPDEGEKDNDTLPMGDTKNVFKAGLYFKCTDDIANCAAMLQGCTLIKASPVKESSLKDQWVFMETTDSPRCLLHKLMQLERAVRLLPTLNNELNPAALCVLMSGSDEEISMTHDLWKQLPSDALIWKYPLYIAWIPTSEEKSKVVTISKQEIDKVCSRVHWMWIKVLVFQQFVYTWIIVVAHVY